MLKEMLEENMSSIQRYQDGTSNAIETYLKGFSVEKTSEECKLSLGRIVV